MPPFFIKKKYDKRDRYLYTFFFVLFLFNAHVLYNEIFFLMEKLEISL